MTNIFKAGNGVRVVGHNGRIGRQIHGGDAEHSGPIFGNRFVPHAVVGFGADGWAKVRVGILDGELAPFGNVGAKPLFDFERFFFKIIVPGGDEDTLTRVKSEASKVLSLVKDRLYDFEQFVTSHRCTDVVGTPSDSKEAAVAVFGN